MADLRGMVERLGFENVRSLLNSGNLVFSGGSRSDAELEAQLEREAAKQLGLKTDFMVRSLHEWEELIEANPFTKEAKSDPSHLVAMVLKGQPAAAEVKALQAAIKGPEQVRATGRQLYVTYPAGIGQ